MRGPTAELVLLTNSEHLTFLIQHGSMHLKSIMFTAILNTCDALRYPPYPMAALRKRNIFKDSKEN